MPDATESLGALVEVVEDQSYVDAEGVLDVGSLVGQRYVIEEHISSGGFGAVYRASDRDIRHHQVALKLLHRGSVSEEGRQAALRELKLLATVTHPSVVQFKEYGWHEGRLWFAMPWYRGQTLDSILERTSRAGMSRAEARPLFIRLAHGLAAMHAVGIHHHDIKPENIFVAQIAGFPGGLPVLLDLGIATQRGENPVGLTVAYASPETAAAMLGDVSVPIGGAADVYSLALVLRNALDPRLAKPAQTTDLMRRLRARATEPAALSSRRELRYMLPYFRRWLSHDPNERPSAAELAEELAILTQPEERRQARMRFVRRVAPTLLLSGLMITALVFQLRRKETALVVQGRELQQQRQVREELQKRSAVQLDQLDLSARKLGNERRLLNEALVFARKLDGQLAEASKRFEELDRRHSEITAERDSLSLDAQRLTAERDRLAEAEKELTRDRATVVAERDELSANLTRVTNELEDTTRARDKLADERARLSAESERLTAERDRASTEASSLAKRVDALTKERDGLTRDVAAKNAQHEEDVRERAEALVERRELERQLAQPDTQRVQQPEAKPAPKPRKVPVKKRPRVRRKRR